MKILKRLFAFIVLMIFALGCTLIICAFNPELTMKLSNTLYGPAKEEIVEVRTPKTVEEYTEEALRGYINDDPQTPLRWKG